MSSLPPPDPPDPIDTAGPLDVGDAAAVIAAFDAAAAATRDDPRRRGATVHLTGPGRVWVTGDLHDHTLNFRRILRAAGLDGHAPTDGVPASDDQVLLQEVIHGPDQINGMDLSVRTLARCADLKQRFPARVVVLQSNHELAQLRGERITKEGVSVVEAFAHGLDFLYGSDADGVREAMQGYIASLPLAARTHPGGEGGSGGGVMMTHSLPAPKHIEAFDKGLLDRATTEADLSPGGSAYDLVWGRYHNVKITQELAEAWGVDALVVGHQPADAGWEAVAENALIIASDHGHGQALPLDPDRRYTRDELIEALVPLAAIRTG